MNARGPIPEAGSGDVLTTKQAAAFLGRTPKTLANWRSGGKGPAFLKPSPKTIFYNRQALTDWLGRERSSTSDTGEKPNA